ncbi:hypothetical protein DPR02_26430 [Burkholderia cepacia]|uniref:Uncharacterized protein n=1 Tax=Burkholderia cepacia TaxID=292 RepID=A0AAQ0F8R7_BURCE|nr:hypothetical protein DPR02_26430 [Burkholderia cepacia]
MPSAECRVPSAERRAPSATCRCVDARAVGQPRTVSCRTATPGRPIHRHPSATRFRPPPRAGKVARACQIGLLRENTDPPTTGNS